MDKDALTRRADFRCTDGVGNRLTEHFDVLSVCLPDQRVDLSAIVGAVICHRQQDTFDFQLWVDLPMHLVDGLQKLFQTFRGKVLCLYGYQSSVCRRQRVDGQHPKGRSTVQQNIVIFLPCAVQDLFQHLFAAHGIDKGNFHPCQLYVGWDEVYSLCMVQHTFTGWNALIVHSFCHQGGKGSGQFIGLLPAHADGQAALWVGIHQQDFFALHRQPDAQIFTGGGLAGAAFLVDDGNRGCFL